MCDCLIDEKGEFELSGRQQEVQTVENETAEATEAAVVVTLFTVVPRDIKTSKEIMALKK